MFDSFGPCGIHCIILGLSSDDLRSGSLVLGSDFEFVLQPC